jgi:hypothetical protein
MVGHLKAASIIWQCARCYSLRDIESEPRECPSCFVLLGVRTVAVIPLVLNEPSNDLIPTEQSYGCVSEAELHGRGKVH